MIRALFFFALISLSLSHISAKANSDSEIDNLKIKLKSLIKSDTNRVKALTDVGIYYSYRYPSYREHNDLDSAYKYLDQAHKLSIKVGVKDFIYNTMGYLGAYYIETDKIQKGINLILNGADGEHKIGFIESEASMLNALADWLNWKANSNLKNRQPINSPTPLANLCIKGSMLALKRYKRTNLNNSFRIYYNIGHIYAGVGDTKNELKYLLEGAKSINNKTTLQGIDIFYFSIAMIYEKFNNYTESLFWSKKAIRLDVKNATSYKIASDRIFYLSLAININSLIKLNRPKEALLILNKNLEIIPPVGNTQKATFNNFYGDCYTALKQYKIAETYYLKMMDLSQIKETDATQGDLTFYVNNCENIINFFVVTKQYKKVGAYLKKLSAFPENYLSFDKMQRAQNSRFKVDSASGNYLSAISDYQKLVKMQDSLNKGNNYRQLTELQVKYETFKKEQSIKNLENNSVLQKSELQKTSLQRNITFGGIAIAMIIASLIYAGYRAKNKSNIELQNKQEEINKQNINLQYLVNDKDKLLTEKDWLIKEVHHRVKNNLQIVMSLLSSQSAYLENNTAIEAIRESQNRVHAISLIHQKLYSSSNVASINMQSYVADLVFYLADSFNTRSQKIRFEQVVEPINLDLAQAVPLGLILNESVTNAIKYAFNLSGGVIVIGLQLLKEEYLLLTISDNGKGIKPNLDLDQTSTLGMEMMKALSKQLAGKFKMNNKSGVKISVEFRIEKTFSNL